MSILSLHQPCCWVAGKRYRGLRPVSKTPPYHVTESMKTHDVSRANNAGHFSLQYAAEAIAHDRRTLATHDRGGSGVGLRNFARRETSHIRNVHLAAAAQMIHHTTRETIPRESAVGKNERVTFRTDLCLSFRISNEKCCGILYTTVVRKFRHNSGGARLKTTRHSGLCTQHSCTWSHAGRLPLYTLSTALAAQIAHNCVRRAYTEKWKSFLGGGQNRRLLGHRALHVRSHIQANRIEISA